jgi:hypothetical protein
MQKPKTVLPGLQGLPLICFLLLLLPSTVINAQIKDNFPDTLVIHEYIIVVETYDKGGVWDDRAKVFKNLNGIGWIKFRCGQTFPEWPLLSKNTGIQPVSGRITGSQSIPEHDITDNNNKRPFEGICVRFSDVVASVIKAGSTACKVLDGIAVYPTTPIIPAVPFTWNIHSGFTLEVSEMRFSPTRNALVTAQLLLPVSITQNEGCSRGKLNLGSFSISPTCEFYVERPDSTFGFFGVGNTTLGIGGRGYVADFSASTAYTPSGKPVSWKGVVLMKGGSKGSPAGTVISNIGYMQAGYGFTNGLVESDGLTAAFHNTAPYQYGAAQPFGYIIGFDSAVVHVASSQVSGGSINKATITLPKTAVRQVNDKEVILNDANLAIRPSMDLSGHSIIKTDITVYWGDLIAAGGGNRKSFGIQQMTRVVWLFFSAQNVPAFNPTNITGKKFAGPALINGAVVEAYKIQGATFTDFGILVVNTPNIPKPWKPNDPTNPPDNSPVWFRLNNKDTSWLNVVSEGVHCNIKGDIMDSPDLELGDPTKPQYVGGKSFKTLTQFVIDPKNNIRSFSHIVLQCVESAVINCDFRSHIKMPKPVEDTFAFKEMVFTSTANNAGGKLALKPGDGLAYWGLQLIPKPGFDNSGLVSVKTGQIILTAAGLAEPRHFAQPFWLTWGEMLAKGSMGELFFDYNIAGQQFDKFNYTHDKVALSPIDTDTTKKGFLRVGGTAFFPFFGADYLHIIDTYTPNASADPHNGRTITLSDSAFETDFFPTDSIIHGNWSNGLGVFDFTIRYAALGQDGFIGNGMSDLRNLKGGALGSSLTMNSRGSCIRIGTNLMDQRTIAIGPLANISNITRIWGCACIANDGIENLVVGGEVTNAANMSVAARTGSYLSAIMQITPSLAKITIDGEAFMSLALSLDAMVSGHMQLTMNWAGGYMEGEVSGKFRVAEGSLVLSGSSLQAEGQLNWHLGTDFNELQGMVALKMMSGGGIPGLGAGVGEGSSIGAAFYIGMNAPKDRAWVLLGSDPRYSLNMAAMPNNLTGIYGSLYVSRSVSLFIVSGGYELYVGLGAFTLTPESATLLGALAAGPGLPYVVGNLGGRIHGEILGGLVSAAAWFNLQIMGPYPFGFEGTVGLEACVLWVACGSVDVTIGLNTAEGFYIR